MELKTKGILLFLLIVFVTIWLIIKHVPITEKFEPNRLPIFVISLTISTHRRDKIKNILEKANQHFQYYDAVLGSNLNSHETQLRDALIVPNSKITAGEIGCFLSHILLWKHIVNLDIERAIIFEDDINPVASFDHIMTICSLKEVQDVDILYLGHYFSLGKGQPIAQVGNYEINKSVRALTTHAYMVTRKGCKRLLEYFNNQKSDDAIDQELAKAAKKNKILSYSVNPSLVDQDKSNGPNSIIDIWRRPERVNEKAIKEEILALNLMHS